MDGGSVVLVWLVCDGVCGDCETVIETGLNLESVTHY